MPADEMNLQLIGRLLKALDDCWVLSEYSTLCEECSDTVRWLQATFPDVPMVFQPGWKLAEPEPPPAPRIPTAWTKTFP